MYFNLSFLKAHKDVDFLKTIIDTVEDAIIIQNMSGENICFNLKAIRILELTDEQLLGGSTDADWSPVKVNGEALTFDELPTTVTRKTGIAQQDVIMGLKTGKGQRKWLRVNTERIEFKKEFFVIATYLDITERYNIYRDTKIKEERWKLALEGSDLGVWDLDIETGEVYFSKQWYEMLGYQPEDLEASFDLHVQLAHPDDLEEMQKQFYGYISGDCESFVIEHRLRCKDGTWKWIHSSGKIMSYSKGKPKRIAGTNKDITKTKLVQEELFISRSKFYNAYHYSSIGMALVSLEGKWMDINPALLSMIGYSTEEILTLTFQDITHPDDLATDLENLQKMLDGEISSYSMEKRYFHKNGTVVWVLLTVSLVRTGDNLPQYFISQIVDITQTKQLIEELRHKNDLLTTTSKSLEDRLNQMLDSHK